MKKKLFALALCVIMVVAMAVPAFADTEYKHWDIVRPNTSDYSAFNMSLSLYGSVKNNCPLSTWNLNGSTDQFWLQEYNSALGGTVVHTKSSPTYGLNAYTILRQDGDGNYYSADIYPITGNSDARVLITSASHVGEVGSRDTVKNVSTGYYLTVSGRKTSVQPSTTNSTSYYIGWYSQVFDIASRWRILADYPG